MLQHKTTLLKNVVRYLHSYIHTIIPVRTYVQEWYIHAYIRTYWKISTLQEYRIEYFFTDK